MALDSRNSRAAATGMGLPFLISLPDPDVGAEDQADRQHHASYYPGILAGAPAASEPYIYQRNALLPDGVP